MGALADRRLEGHQLDRFCGDDGGADDEQESNREPQPDLAPVSGEVHGEETALEIDHHGGDERGEESGDQSFPLSVLTLG